MCAHSCRRNICCTPALQLWVTIHWTPLGQYLAQQRTPLRSKRCLTQSLMTKYVFVFACFKMFLWQKIFSKPFFFLLLDVNTPLSLQDLSRPFLSFLSGRLCSAHAATLSDRWSVSERDRAIPPQVQLQKCTQSGSVGQSGQCKNPYYTNCVKRHRFLLCKLWEMVKVTRSLTEIYFTLFGFFSPYVVQTILVDDETKKAT